jgi:hypothetical protein
MIMQFNMPGLRSAKLDEQSADVANFLLELRTLCLQISEQYRTPDKKESLFAAFIRMGSREAFSTETLRVQPIDFYDAGANLLIMPQSAMETTALDAPVPFTSCVSMPADPPDDWVVVRFYAEGFSPLKMDVLLASDFDVPLGQQSRAGRIFSDIVLHLGQAVRRMREGE